MSRFSIDLEIAVFATGLGAIPLGSSAAFIDLTGSFIILTTVSYAIPIVANQLTRRKYLPKSSFSLDQTTSALVGWGAVILIALFNIFDCFREFPTPPFLW